MKVDLDTLKFVSLMNDLARRTSGGFVPKRRAEMTDEDAAADIWKNRIVYEGKRELGVFYPLMWESDEAGISYKRDSMGRTVGEYLSYAIAGNKFDVTVVEDEGGLRIVVVILGNAAGTGECFVVRDGSWRFVQ